MSLQIWLPLNGDLHDQGLKNINAVNNGATVDNNGKIGKCYSFNGSSYIDTGYIESFGTGDFTICCWMYLTQTSGKTYQCIIGNKATAANSVGISLYYNQNQKKFLWSTADGSNATEIWSVDTFDTVIFNQWHHIAMVRDNNDSKKGYFYFDGIRKEIASIPAIRNVSSTTSLKIGSITPIYTPYYFTGKINDVRIYDHALNEKEIEKLAKGLVLHYKLNEQFYEPTTNLITSISAGGQTTVSNNIVTTSGTNADTYFELKLSESIVSGTQYTIQCRADMPSGTTWTFPIGAQGNSSLSWVLHPGYNEYTFTANNISWGEKRIFMDDLSGTARTSGKQCRFYNFQLEKKNHATSFVGYGKARGSQYDENIYVEPDGSRWIRIAHHNSPTDNGYFSKTDPWESGVYLNEHKWYCVNSAIAQVSKYEFMVKQKTTSSASEQKWRWTQDINPLIAVYNDVKPGTVIINTSSGYTSSSFGGLWQMNASARLCIANASSGNWYGAFGCWTVYQTNQIPGYPNTNVSTGYLDLYINIDETNLGIVYDSSGYNNNGTIIGPLETVTPSPKYNYTTKFDGNTSCIQVPYKEINPDGIFTLNLWFFKDALGSKNYETLFGGPSGFEMDTRAGTSTTLSLYMASTRGGSMFSPFSLNTWYMVTLVRDGTNEFYYVNGELKKTIEAKPMPSGQYRIGAWASDTGQNYYGNISDFRLYATAFTAEQVKELYNNSMIINGIDQIPRDLE